jgi:hypothetical protein
MLWSGWHRYCDRKGQERREEAMEKKEKRAQGKVKIKDLAVRKQKGAAVKGGRTIRITNVRANANAIGIDKGVLAGATATTPNG